MRSLRRTRRGRGERGGLGAEGGAHLCQVGRWLGIFVIVDGQDEDGEDRPFISESRIFMVAVAYPGSVACGYQ